MATCAHCSPYMHARMFFSSPFQRLCTLNNTVYLNKWVYWIVCHWFSFSLSLSFPECVSVSLVCISRAIHFLLADDGAHCMFLIKIFDAVKQDTVIHFIHVFRGKKVNSLSRQQRVLPHALLRNERRGECECEWDGKRVLISIMYIDPIICIKHWHNRSGTLRAHTQTRTHTHTASFSQTRILALQALITIDGKGMSSVLQTRFDSVTFRVCFSLEFFVLFCSVHSLRAWWFVVRSFFPCTRPLPRHVLLWEVRINAHKMNRTKGITFIPNCVQNHTCTRSHPSRFAYTQANTRSQIEYSDAIIEIESAILNKMQSIF